MKTTRAAFLKEQGLLIMATMRWLCRLSRDRLYCSSRGAMRSKKVLQSRSIKRSKGAKNTLLPGRQRGAMLMVNCSKRPDCSSRKIQRLPLRSLEHCSKNRAPTLAKLSAQLSRSKEQKRLLREEQ